MSPMLKKLLIIVAGLVGLLGVALAVVAFTFDPNDYKDQIQAEVKKHSGRDLLLSGPLSLSVFPWLGVEANDVALSNAAGFDDQRFAAIEHVEVRLRLLPLLQKQIELGKVSLSGLELNLQRKTDGSTNWDDLVATEDASAQQLETEEAPSGGAPDLSIAGLELANARIQWRDGDALTVVEGLNLSTGPIAENQASELALNVGVTLADQTKVLLDLSSGWQFTLQGPSASLSDFNVKLSAEGAAVPGQQQALSLQMNASYDGQSQSAQISDGRLEFADQLIQLAGGIEGLDKAQKLQLQLSSDNIDLARLGKQLALSLPPEASSWPALSLKLEGAGELAADTLSQADLNLNFGELKLALNAALSSVSRQAGSGRLTLSPLDLHAFLARLGYPLALKKSPGMTQLEAQIAMAPDSLELKPIKGSVAGEALSGSVSLSNFAKPVIRANLDLAGVKLADWSAEPDDKSQAQQKPEQGGDINEMEVPMDWAKGLNLTARVALSRLNAYGIKFRDVRWTADARPGTPVRQKLVANAYGGELAVNNSIDASSTEPVIGLNMSAKAIGLGDFLQDGWGSRWISGTTELGMNLNSRGKTVGKMRSSANGDANYRLKDGEVKGVSLLDLVQQASALAGGGKSQSKGDSTSFSELVGRFLVESGKLKVQDLGGNNPWFKFAGDGVVDLLAGQYNLSLAPVLLENETTKKDKTLSKLVGLAIPIDVRGPLTAPKFKVNLEDVLKQKAQAEVDKEVEKQKDKLRNKFNEKLGDLLRSQ